MLEKKADVLIIGGGAAGMFAAILCARQGKKVILFEHKNQLGKKILATGNGKCNYTNLYMDEDCYRGNQNGFTDYGIKQFGPQETITYFEYLGITPKEKAGYVYPYSEQASAVNQIFQMELKSLGVQIQYEKVQKIEKKSNFILGTEQGKYQGKYVILATGGKASPKLGSDGSGYILAKKLGHHIVEPVPALIGLKCEEEYYKEITGVRMQARVSLFEEQEQRAIVSEEGELQLTAYGISGIPVFQISRYAARALQENKSIYAKIDYMPAFSKEELFELLKNRFSMEKRTTLEAMVGLLNQKLIETFLKKSGISVKKSAGTVNEVQLHQLVNMLKGMKTVVVDTNGFEHAQVTAGGVDTLEISNQTMESKKCKDLFFVGEIMDVDGICGGYNLQWCWSSAYLASCAICEKNI